MSDSTKETPETQNPVAPEAAPEVGDAEATGVAPVVAASADDNVADAEPVLATAAAPEPVEPGSGTTDAPVMAGAASATTTGRRKREERPKRGPVRPAGPAPLSHFAVVETGGKQYRVSVGDTIAVERLMGEAGEQITLDRVLMVGGNGEPQIGAPVVEGASVTATIESQYRGEKIVVFKFKPKKRYRRRTGHRQELTRLAITGISA
ncbi:MAG TPA: 50S ribosomal protein L21 [Thermomicrobiales bacterium]|jgi:large subunit ribosomal protein L21|nr:50S ribosomal protein L21 [Thermomicrobiales bacterium]